MRLRTMQWEGGIRVGAFVSGGWVCHTPAYTRMRHATHFSWPRCVASEFFKRWWFATDHIPNSCCAFWTRAAFDVAVRRHACKVVGCIGVPDVGVSTALKVPHLQRGTKRTGLVGTMDAHTP